MNLITCAIFLVLGHFVLADDCLFEVVSDPASQFKTKISHVPLAEISDVLSLSLGMATEPVSYSGLLSGDIFHRPSAVLSLVWEVIPGTIETCSLSQHENINFRTTRDYILSEFDEERPTVVDYASSIKVTRTPKSLDNALSTIPRTLDGMLELLEEDDSVLHTHDLNALNTTKPVDLNFLSELQLIKEVFDKVSQNTEDVIDGTPDLYTFELSGLRDIQEQYGSESAQAQEASNVMADFLNEVYKKVESLYKKNILITIVKVERNQALQRMIRAVSATVPPTTAPEPDQKYNLATYYSSDFPVMFNIVLWLVVIFALAVYAISYMVASMDPGDTIIYRMTSQRIKME